MKEWHELSEAAKLRRLRAIAWTAVGEYGIDVHRLSLVGGFVNAIYRLDTPDGPFALRVDLHLEHTDTDTLIELDWLVALHRDTDLPVVKPVVSADGRRFVYAEAPGVPQPRRCTVFEWIGGSPLADRADPDSYRRLGELSAGLHRHGAGYRPPARPMAWDRTFYWPESVDPVVIDDPERRHHFSPGDKEVIDAARVAVDRAFTRLNPDEAQIVHGDLHPWNVHRMRSRLIALDFEDVLWGHPVQDAAITLSYLRDRPDHADLAAAFEEGYSSLLPWPVDYPGQLDHFMAARTIMFINYTMNIGGVDDYLPVAVPRLRAFLERWG